MHLKILSILSFTIFISIILFSCKKDQSLPSPASINITNLSDTGCSINWTAVSGASSYKITLALDASFLNVVSGYNEMAVTNTSIIVTTLTPYKKYFVKIIAFDGQDNSTPAITDFMTNDADGLVILPWDFNKLYAFDARNGNVKWTFTGAQIYATPIIQDSIVYVGGGDGRLYALNVADGSQKWRSATTTNGSFFTANPLIKNGVVYIGDYGGRCHAYNANDGSSKWSYDIPSPYKNINSTPILDGNTIYFASYDGKIYALDAGNGSYKWASASTGNPISSGMSLVNGTIYVGAIPKVYAFNATTGTIKWITPTPVYTQFTSSPTVVDNSVFIGGEDGIMYAFNTANGSITWSKSLSYGSIVSSPVYKNGIVYVGGGDGKMYALQSNTGNLVWQNSDASTQNIYSGPTLSDRAVYSGTLGGKVVAMNIQTGTTKWITAIPGARFEASPSVITYKGDVYYPGLSGDVQ
ncbi:MAG TPA: PQQ-binding-like beta-propeller repeat protein [Ferruginibacter sp.]|nr:PQQ-binding-like beta-propeller repeat protein [Ferruginibacter sp.]